MKQVLYSMMNNPLRTVGEFLCVLGIFAMGYIALVMFG